MSLGAVLSNAMSGLAVAQHALSVTSGNVANVNTEGYARKLVQQAAVVVDGQGAGVRAAETTRAIDTFLAARLREQQAVLGRSEVLAGYQRQIQDRVFGTPGDQARGIGALLGKAATAAEALAGAPGDTAAATAFINAVQDLGLRLDGAGDELNGLRRDADQQIAATVGAINADLRDLAGINAQLAGGGGADLLDRRDQLLESLAGKLDISVHARDDGAVAIYTRGGQVLLDGQPRQLSYAPAASVATGTVFAPIGVYPADQVDTATGLPLTGAIGATLVGGGVRTELTPELLGDATPDADQRIASPLRGGSLQGLLEARDLVLPGLADQLGELAGLAAHLLNAAHNAAVPYPPPSRLAGTRTDTAGFASAVRSGTAYLAVVDRTTGTIAATLAIDVAGAGDAATLAAQIDSGLGALGAAGLDADGALTLAAADGYALALAGGDSTITTTDAAGHRRSFGFAHYFGLNDLVGGGTAPSARLAVRADIAADATRLARSRLDIDPGPPPVGRLGGAGDDRGAQGLAAAFATGAGTVARAGLPAGVYRPADYAAQIVALGALAAQRAEGAEANDRALAEDLGTRRAEVSGVNLDEEMSRLVLYQEAYSVSARLVAITADLFDDLLAMVG